MAPKTNWPEYDDFVDRLNEQDLRSALKREARLRYQANISRIYCQKRLARVELAVAKIARDTGVT